MGMGMGLAWAWINPCRRTIGFRSNEAILQWYYHAHLRLVGAIRAGCPNMTLPATRTAMVHKGSCTMYSFPVTETYRAFRSDWVGTPSYRPSQALISNGGGTDVYASWNGSTETTAWRVLAGSTPNSLSVASLDVSRTGFETIVRVDSAGPYFEAQALGSGGQVLGTSLVRKIR
jgi:hypothetical protein